MALCGLSNFFCYPIFVVSEIPFWSLIGRSNKCHERAAREILTPPISSPTCVDTVFCSHLEISAISLYVNRNTCRSASDIHPLSTASEVLQSYVFYLRTQVLVSLKEGGLESICFSC